MSSLEVWTATIRALDALGPSLSTSVSAEAENAPLPAANSSSLNLIAKRRDVGKRHELLLRALELHSIEEKCLSVLEKRAQNAKLVINRLPVELLLMIFVEFVASLAGDWDRAEPLYTSRCIHPLRLAGVCHHWKSIALGRSGAPLWTDLIARTGGNDASLRAARQLHAWLPRSGSLHYDLVLNDYEDGDERIVADAVFPHASRCQSLSVSGLSHQKLLFPLDLTRRWTSLAHLTVNMIDDDDMLDAEERPPPIFHVDESRYLETLTIQTWLQPSIESITSSLGALSTCIGIKRLDLRHVLFHIDSLVWLLRFFPGLVWLQFGSDQEFQPEANDGPLAPNTPLVSLPQLETLEFRLTFSVEVVMRALDVPKLKTLRVALGDGLVPSALAPSLSRLEVLELSEPEDTNYNLASIVRSPRALHSIYYSRHWKNLYVGVDQLNEFARSFPTQFEAERGLAEDEPSGEGLPLTLYIGPTSAQPGGVPAASSSEAKDFVIQLDALGMMREARKRAYGSMFRIQVSPRLVEWWPAVAEVVQRHPDFFALGELHSFETAWWERS